MASIKSIKVGETVYDLKATYDSLGNNIELTYAKKSETGGASGAVVIDSSGWYLDTVTVPENVISILKTAVENHKVIVLNRGSSEVPLYHLVTLASKSTDLLALENIFLTSTNLSYSIEGGTVSEFTYWKIDTQNGTLTKYTLNLGVDTSSFLTKTEAEDTYLTSDGLDLALYDLSGNEGTAFGSTVADVNDLKEGIKNVYTKTESDDKYQPKGNYLTEHLDISGKVDKVEGKQLSTEDYTTAEKSKLSGIEALANKYVHPTTPGNKHIPSGGKKGQILVSSGNEEVEWKDDINYSNFVDLYSYGVEWDITVASPELTRIGNPLLHKSLPILSAYRGCVSNGTTINYYLCPDNWAFKEDGVTPSVLDGTDGVVRVHIPKFYGKSGSNGNKRWVRISIVKIDDSWMEIPEMLVDAYRCTVDTTDSATLKAVSVVNTAAEFRGGSNRTANDTYLETDKFKSDLGKPRTNLSRANMRTYATNAGSELLCYEYYKWIFYWNYVIEYANFNALVAYNSELTSDGYRQGGLGAGVTTWDWSLWNGYNGNNPITPCGYCNEFGNFTGVKDLEVPAATSKTFSVPRWRGFDNPFGDIWTNLEGIVIKRDAANLNSRVYTTTSEFTDVIGSKTIAGIELAKDGFIKLITLGDRGDIIPSNCDGTESTYLCDYHYCNPSSTSLRTLLVGGGAHDGGPSGPGCFNSNDDVGFVRSHVGFRTLTKLQ